MTRLVIYAPNWLGDAVMARTFVATAMQHHHAAGAVIVTHPRTSGLWRNWPGLQVVETRRGFWLKDAAHTARRLRRRGPFDVGYLLSPSLRSALVLALAGIPERIGFAGGGRSWLLTRPVPRLPAGRMHYAREMLHLLDGNPRIAYPAPMAWPESVSRRLACLLANRIPGGTEFLVVAVGAAGRIKRLPPSTWRAALAPLAPKLPVVLVGTAQESSLADAIGGVLGRNGVNLCGRTGLPELAVLLSKAAGFAGVDSGAAHLAAAVGCPTLVLFGPGDVTETRPRGDAVRVLRADLWCSPCRSRTCLRLDHPSLCMDLLEPQAITSAVLSLLADRADRAPTGRPETPEPFRTDMGCT